MSRSCHSGTPSSTGTYCARTMRASPQIRSLMIGFFLCGIAEEPFWPRPNGSDSSRTSVRCPCRTSSAIASQIVASPASAATHEPMPSRSTTWVATDAGCSPSAAATRPSTRRLDVGVGADGAADLADRDVGPGRPQPVAAAGRAEREVGDAVAEHRRLGVDAVGAPDPQRRPVREPEVAQRGDQPVGLLQHQVGRVDAAAARARCRAGRSEVMPKCT